MPGPNSGSPYYPAVFALGPDFDDIVDFLEGAPKRIQDALNDSEGRIFELATKSPLFDAQPLPGTKTLKLVVVGLKVLKAVFGGESEGGTAGVLIENLSDTFDINGAVPQPIVERYVRSIADHFSAAGYQVMEPTYIGDP
jgi:hypothetical protein